MILSTGAAKNGDDSDDVVAPAPKMRRLDVAVDGNVQKGVLNRAGIGQVGIGHRGKVKQRGALNSGGILQSGAGNDGEIDQDGIGNSAVIIQE